MRKAVYKYCCCFVLTVLFLLLVLYSAAQYQHPPFYFHMKSGDGAVMIRPHQAESGKWYVFLPSYARMEDLEICISMGKSLMLDGICLDSGMNCSGCIPEREYTLSIGAEEETTLSFLQSSAVGVMYLDTRSGTMDYVHDDKENEESVFLRLYDAEGNLDYANEHCSIKGRGNGTWTYEKKPYQITLPKPDSLLDMADGTKWLLLANAADESNLHNKLVYDLGKKLDMGWVPDCTYVDLYLNGAYNGLYLLSEKVEVSDNRVNLDVDAGAFLGKIELGSRWEQVRNPIRTSLGRTAEITAPLNPSDAQISEISEKINNLEQCILSGEDLRKTPEIHLESWIYRYLIDEISGNMDADAASSYFYSTDGCIFAGPLWDYDMTFGNHFRNATAEAFIAKNLKKAPRIRSYYYDALYSNPYFYEAMTEIYRDEFLPVLGGMITHDIPQAAQTIGAASRMNSIRWGTMFQELYDQGDLIRSDAEGIAAYLQRRIAFLNSAWLEGVSYCTVQYQLEEDSSYGSISLPKGTVPDVSCLNSGVYTWYVEKTGEPFDPKQPVEEDMLLLLSLPGKGEEAPAA